tara:strand:+ start:143 stop:310 length:168 start_codon:yes stop_codon:yes gene_type:complete
MVSPWRSQKVIVETINSLKTDLLATNVEMKDVIHNQTGIKEIKLNPKMFGKIGGA